MKCFGQKVAYMQEDILRLKMLSEEFTDLLEDAIPQAARAMVGRTPGLYCLVFEEWPYK
jgi:hypothetical protein